MSPKKKCRSADCTNKTENQKKEYCKACYKKLKQCSTQGCKAKRKNLDNPSCGKCQLQQAKSDDGTSEQEECLATCASMGTHENEDNQIQLRCLGCLNPLESKDNFCRICGQKVPSQQASETQIKRPPAKDVAAIKKEKVLHVASENQGQRPPPVPDISAIKNENLDISSHATENQDEIPLPDADVEVINKATLALDNQDEKQPAAADFSAIKGEKFVSENEEEKPPPVAAINKAKLTLNNQDEKKTAAADCSAIKGENLVSENEEEKPPPVAAVNKAKLSLDNHEERPPLSLRQDNPSSGNDRTIKPRHTTIIDVDKPDAERKKLAPHIAAINKAKLALYNQDGTPPAAADCSDIKGEQFVSENEDEKPPAINKAKLSSDNQDGTPPAAADCSAIKGENLVSENEEEKPPPVAAVNKAKLSLDNQVERPPLSLRQDNPSSGDGSIKLRHTKKIDVDKPDSGRKKLADTEPYLKNEGQNKNKDDDDSVSETILGLTSGDVITSDNGTIHHIEGYAMHENQFKNIITKQSSGDKYPVSQTTHTVVAGLASTGEQITAPMQKTTVVGQDTSTSQSRYNLRSNQGHSSDTSAPSTHSKQRATPVSNSKQEEKENNGSSVDNELQKESNHQTQNNTSKPETRQETTQRVDQQFPSNAQNDERRGNVAYKKGNSRAPSQALYCPPLMPYAISDYTEGQMMRIHFNAVLTPEFQFNPHTDAVYIRFGLDSLGSFLYNAVKMIPVKYDNNYVFMTGMIEVKPQYLKYPFIEYKYCHVRGEQYLYEFLYNQYNESVVNRALMIKKMKLCAGEVWHQYDNMIHHPMLKDFIKEKFKEEQKSYFEQFVGLFSRSNLISNRDDRIASDYQQGLLSYLPIWEGFVCKNCTPLDPSFAIKWFLHVAECMQGVWTKKDSFLQPQRWIPRGYSSEKVILQFLEPKITELGCCSAYNVHTLIKTLISSLAIVHIIRKCKIQLTESQHVSLLHALALPPNLNKITYDYVIGELKKAFYPILAELIKSLEVLCKKAMFDASWWLVVPLLHFLRGDSKPIEWPTNLDKHNYHDVAWWGHNNLDIKENKKYRNVTLEQIKGIIPHLQWLFQIDVLLQRTFLSSMDLHQLTEIFRIAKFDFYITCCTIGQRVRQMFDVYNQLSYLQDLLSVLLVINDKVKDDESSDTQLTEQDYKATPTVLEALNCLKNCSYADEYNTVVLLLQLFVASVDRCVTHSSLATDEWMETAKEYVVEAGQLMNHLIKSLIERSGHTDSVIGFLNSLFNVVFNCSKFQEIWETILYKSLQESVRSRILNSTYRGEQVVTFYCHTDFRNLHVKIEEAFAEVAFGVIDKVMEATGLENILYNVTHGSPLPREATKYGRIFSHLLESSLSHPDAMTLQHQLQWKPLASFFRMAVRGKSSIALTEKAQSLLFEAKSLMEDLVLNSIFNGTIAVKDLKLIRQEKDQFLKICDVIDVARIAKKHLPSDMTNIKFDVLMQKLIKQRERELNVFDDFTLKVGVMITMCRDIHYEDSSGRKILAVDIKETEKLLTVDRDSLQLIEFCCPPDFHETYTSVSPPKIIFFNFSNEIVEMLPKIQRFYLSSIFQQFWKRTVRRVLMQRGKSEGLMKLNDVEKLIWQNVKNDLENLGQSLMSGNITLQSVEENLSSFSDEDLESHFKIFESDSIPNNWIKERCDQICLYRQIARCFDTANTIHEIQETFQLAGDFSAIDVLCSTTNKDFKKTVLRELNIGVENACRELKKVSKEESECLKMLIESKTLINWIKKEIKSVQELKVFVDLAMIQAGETPIEVDRVACLHQAATGYSAFIFDLNEDAGYKELMNICNLTWKALKNDPQLSKKLRDVSRLMEWLKGIKESHGAVEVTSLRQVERINADGMYEIGKLAEGSLQLRVPVENREGIDEDKIYTVQQLKDLQSKLMLVAGKAHRTTGAKEEVDRFVEVFDGAQDLETYYHKMCASGNVLFTDLKIILKCNKNSKSPVQVDFRVTEQKPLFANKQQLTDILKELLVFMKESLKNWYDYIDEKREDFYHLNVYTTKQLVILQRALAKFGKQDVSPEIYALLSLVRPNCTVQDLRKAVVEVSEETNSSIDEENVIEDVTREDVVDESKEELIEFWNKLKEMYDDEQQTMAFIEHKRSLNVQEAVMYLLGTSYEEKELKEFVTRFIDRVGCNLSDLCNDNEELENKVVQDKKMEKELVGPVSLKNQGFGTYNVKNYLLQGMDKNATLVKKLKILWEKYLSKTKTVDLSDYASLETLGMLLQCLASSDKTKRSFPQVFKTGCPNLIVSPARNVLNTVLSVYMENNESLPSYDEVLLCNSTTSLEEVVLLWRRALNGDNNKTYCLVNADVLNYDVSVEAVTKLNHLMKGKHGFKLVIICNQEREDQSHMVAALNSDRISSNKLTCRKQEEIQDYLCKQFIQQVKPTNQGLIPAANLTNLRTCVQTVSSKRPGVGKSLLIQRYKERLQCTGQEQNCCITVPLQTPTVQEHNIAKKLIREIQRNDLNFPRIFHLDISPNVCGGLDHFLFNLLVLNTICCSDGFVWQRKFYDLYLVEVTLDPKEAESKDEGKSDQKFITQCFYESLPTVLCRPPREVYQLEEEKSKNLLREDFKDPLMDDQHFRSSSFQRPYCYLRGLDEGTKLDEFTFKGDVSGTHEECLVTLLRHCGLCDPSWSELCHFACFLEKQLEACESSHFCKPEMLAGTGLDGFKTFVVRFMLQMSKDFATPSLQMSDESYPVDPAQETDGSLQALQLRRRWESSPHPYIFFNQDHQTMTFMGFSVNRYGTLLDVNGEVLQRNVMTKSLMRALQNQTVNLSEDFNSLPRDEKLKKLCMVMGIKYVSNPDITYELTTDNVKKILAIHMRFRCGIPVIVMGETGCGKTRLIRFMCQLQAGGIVDDEVQNMILMKVHGGTSSEYIAERIHKAEKLAKYNKSEYEIDTILFFDEANTTEAIGIIKEIMCDGRMNGQQIDFKGSGLKIVAACNPYKRHTDEMIERLEAAGLGYHIKASKTTDRLGCIPLRQLVYRVQALPPSMLPLVWDFGQLNSDVEKMYIKQIVQRFGIVKQQQVDVVCEVLSAAQMFMRKQKNECSFVSLRDVERTLNVMVWFFGKRDLLRPLIEKKKKVNIKEEDIEREEDDIGREEDDIGREEDGIGGEEDDIGREQDVAEFFEKEYEEVDDTENENSQLEKDIDDLTWALVLALGVCYHACLDKKREDFRRTVANSFKNPLNLYGGHGTIYREINSCQDILLDEIRLGPNIARNMALKENIFMMIICIELRIPLFLVGKPGSSKSLAKTIVADAMQGDSSASEIFKKLKQVHMISYQCSPLSTPDGIVGTFRQCSVFQQSKDLNKFVSVVVLDEVGLAEDSPRMPLKTLHPLLEYGSEEEDNPPAYKKVGFIGISNWALDPAKMNRGILVSRGVPDEAELIESAKGICALDTSHNVSQILRPLAEGYLKIYQEQRHDFFGLRDFYSLIKMVNQFSKNSRAPPTWAEIEHAIRRNFGGMEGIEDYIEIFGKKLEPYIKKEKLDTDPDCTPSGLIKASLDAQGQTQAGGIKKVGHGTSDGDSRYLLVLTEKFSALPILQQHLNTMKDSVIIYGSSFPFDQEYTQVCRNINRIKLYMEAGKTVVLLNLENLYESLYDALNQYYVYFGGQRYVDLGLGTHRVKCRVHDSFRLIVVADKEVVRTRFPIPLINRLEKHFLAMTTMLSEKQLQVVNKVEDWIDIFITNKQQFPPVKSSEAFKKSDAFVGYHCDTVAALVYQTWPSFDTAEEVFEDVKNQLLMCATPESVTRLSETKITENEKNVLQDTYFDIQKHSSLADYLGDRIRNAPSNEGILAQVTTYSRLLTEKDCKALAESTQLNTSDISLVSLQEFQYEQQFSVRVQKFFGVTANERLLLVQCDASSDTTPLISCASYRVQDERENALSSMEEEITNRAHVVFIIQLPRLKRCFNGFQGGLWSSAHIDDLQPPKKNCPDVSKLLGRPISELLLPVPKHENMQENFTCNEQKSKVAEETEDDDNDSEEYNSMYQSDVKQVVTDLVDATVKVMEDEKQMIEEEMEEGSKAVEGSEDVTILALESSPHDEVSLVNFAAVLVDCIHPAMARIIDPSDQRHRSTERVRLLVQLIEGDCAHHEFINALKHLIVSLMKEKEGRSPNPANWLSRKGFIKEVQESGTFRQACWQRLTATVASFLAEVIAACDISNNLHLLMIDQADNCWSHRLWIDIFSSKDLMNMSYDMCISVKKKVQRSEVPVIEKGFGGISFTARFPFSWIVKQKLNEIWKFASEAKGEAEISSEQQFLRNIQESEIGKILQTAITTGNSHDFIESYISDFVSMTCKTTQNDENMLESRSQSVHQLLCKQLSNSSLSIVQQLGGKVESVDMVSAVHLAFNTLQARFEHFSQIVELCPDVLHTLDEEETKNKGEMTLDLTSLKYVLDSFEDKEKNLPGFNQDVCPQEGQRKWLKEIHIVFPLVQRVMDLSKKDNVIYSARNQTILDECRCLWSRITVMKLFFEHVSLPNKEFAELISPNCKAMWMGLGKVANLKTDKSIKILVNILNIMNKRTGKAYYESGIHKCGICEESIADPVMLPCKPEQHVFCKECIEEYFKAEKANKCPSCKSDFPHDFVCKEQSQVSEAITKHNAFRQCCNSFFMEVISQLCFADGTPPSEEVIKRLLGYVTIDSKKQNQLTTKKVSPFPEDCIDPNPVVRSFLLQLLLLSNLEKVKEHVEGYLKHCKSFMKESICTLFINCLEDTYYSGFSYGSVDQICELIVDAQNKIQSAQDFFKRKNNAIDDSLIVELLEAISQIRFAFTTLIDVEQQHHDSIYIENHLSKLRREACEFCKKNKQAQLYIVRYMYKAYGRDAINQLKEDDQLKWILPDELKVQELSIPDYFVIVGGMYKSIREAVGECVVDKDFEKMSKVIVNVKGQEKQKEVCFLLSLFREITMNATTQDKAKIINVETKKNFGKVLQNFPFLRNKVVADTLLMNRVQNPHHKLKVIPGLSHQDYSIQGVVTHLHIVLSVVDGKSLTQCLAMLMKDPSQMQNSYLPAMPQDERIESVKAIRKSSEDDENLTWYDCPNGHIYAIGNCGKPTDCGNCPECNLLIGGSSYNVLHPGNKKRDIASMVDTTATGHVLGDAQQHGSQIVCERTMNCVATAIVRFLMHSSMLLGTECQHGPEPIIRIIKPDPYNVFEFLWRHLHNDVRLLSEATGKSKDDCIFILHKVIDNIFQTQVEDDLQTGFQQLLPSKKCRKTWEENFTAAYIKPALQGLDEMINESNAALSEDKRLSNDPLICLLNAPIEPEDLAKLADTSHVWQYRSRITIHSIHQALENEQEDDTLLVLKHFMEKEKHLRFVRYLPDIVQLQRLLINKFNRHIDASEAINLNIATFLGQLNEREHAEFKRLIDTFIHAWNSLSQDVAATIKLDPKAFFKETVTYNSEIAILLPTRQESGLCCIGLVEFLVTTQNEFLGRYQNIQNEKLSKVDKKSDLLQSHLIAYDPDRDLLPLILSQCQYIVRPMAGDRIEYNLTGLELQVIERFIRGRAFINCKFDQLLFRQDVRNVAIFENLRNNIPQEEFSSKALQHNILAELKSYPDLCGCLASLDIAIGFLANYKPEGDMLINDYLWDKLAMPQNKGLKSATASRHCRLKHVLALWQLLAMKKAVRLTKDLQDPFDGVSKDYRDKLNDEDKTDLIAKLKKFSKLDQLCGELYEYILLNLSSQSEEDRTKWKISSTLKPYYDSKNYHSEITGLDDLLNTIPLSHAVDTWKTIAQLYSIQE